MSPYLCMDKMSVFSNRIISMSVSGVMSVDQYCSQFSIIIIIFRTHLTRCLGMCSSVPVHIHHIRVRRGCLLETDGDQLYQVHNELVHT